MAMPVQDVAQIAKEITLQFIGRPGLFGVEDIKDMYVTECVCKIYAKVFAAVRETVDRDDKKAV